MPPDVRSIGSPLTIDLASTGVDPFARSVSDVGHNL
jgi:hypothetical protein